MSPPDFLTATDIHCILGNKEILRGVNLTLKAGELLGIIGPNGAGKSTLLRSLNGTLPVEGSVKIQGKPMPSLSSRELAREVALMHQNSTISFSFPASEIVMMGRYAHQGRFHPESAEDRRIVTEVMQFTDTGGIARQPINTLSGGERQRVLFAKALAQNTRIFLLDEPSASLDIAHQDQIFRYARRLVADGKAVMAAIHDLRLAARYCTRVILLSQGAIVSEGTPETVLTPGNLEAAYGTKVKVFRNPLTGQLDFHVADVEDEEARIHLHVIGGGGSASEVFRLLGNGKYRVTAGVLHLGDIDLEVAKFYGIPVVTSPPFSPIDDEAFGKNRRLAGEAEMTILGNLPLGSGNLRNLEAAASARRLIILEDDDPQARDFTGGSGLDIYRRLVQKATILKTKQLGGWLEDSRKSR